jgi:molybdate transport system substrate-binding protein
MKRTSIALLQQYPVKKYFVIGLILAISCGLLAGRAGAQNREVLVFAAGTLKETLQEIASQYQRETGKQVRVSLAASPALAKQIENGAPADIFISADSDWMDYLAKRNLIKTNTRRNLLSNKLVLIAPKDSPLQVSIEPGFPLAKLLAGGRLAIGDTNSDPCGRYGKASLEKLGVWSSVAGQIAQAENVRVALALVARKESPLGIVYETDAAVEPNVKVVGFFPEDTYPPIIYPVALTAESKNSDAAAFLGYLSSPKAELVFEKQGFIVLGSR